MYIYSDSLYQTMLEITRIPSTSGHEEAVRAYLTDYLQELGLTTQVDQTGNLIATLPGDGPPLMLNAHMDRVPPGLGHEPVLRNGTLYSDGTTNLGADDSAGMTIILEVLRRIVKQGHTHPTLVVVFTVHEEDGLHGAHHFDPTPWQIREGLVFDNAFEAGIVVASGASYEAIDITITGRTGHPGKDLTETINALEIFRAATYPHGPLPGDLTRINIGRVQAGLARNAIPGQVHIEGEIRSFEPEEIYQRHKREFHLAFEQAAEQLGGSIEIRFTPCAASYTVHPEEPLLLAYQAALAQRGAVLEMRPTFVASDTSAFRPAIRTITISTGVASEHSVEEHIALASLEKLVVDTLYVLYLMTSST